MRPVGQHIRAVLAILDDHGPMTYRETWAHYPCVEMTNVRKYLSRAVAMGLATVDREAFPSRFSVIPGWRAIVDKPKPPKKEAKAPFSARSFGAHNPFGGCYFVEQGEADRSLL
jgi:hypothetical protein